MRSVFLALCLSACAPTQAQPPTEAPQNPHGRALAAGETDAIFAGGCFWCMESSLEAVPGILEVESGYSGGAPNPSYKAVGSGATKHAEVVRVIYDPKVIGYDKLLDTFWHNIDPTQANGQFCDRGRQYRSAVFAGSPEEKALALATKTKVAEQLSQPIVTEIVDRAEFWYAEDYHQDYYKKNPAHYQRYRLGCGRDRRLEELWGKAPASH
jgi:peptide-methionine (S)-S-oxide reductase